MTPWSDYLVAALLLLSGVVVLAAGLGLWLGIAALIIVRAFKRPMRTALTNSVSLAQIGEFSFILAALGDSLGVLPPEAKSLIVAGALLSIALNPLLFRALATRPVAEVLKGLALPERLD